MQNNREPRLRCIYQGILNALIQSREEFVADRRDGGFYLSHIYGYLDDITNEREIGDFTLRSTQAAGLQPQVPEIAEPKLLRGGKVFVSKDTAKTKLL